MRGTTFYSNSTRSCVLYQHFDGWLPINRACPHHLLHTLQLWSTLFFFFFLLFSFLNFLSIMLKIAHCEILCVNKRRSRRVHRQHTMCTCHVWLCMCHIFAAFCEGHGPQKLLTSCAGPDSLKFNWTQSDSTDRFGLTHCSHHEFFFFSFLFFEYCFLYIS